MFVTKNQEAIATITAAALNNKVIRFDDARSDSKEKTAEKNKFNREQLTALITDIAKALASE